MKLLVLGSDGRAHALVWKLFNNPSAEVFVAPGNGGATQLAPQVDLDPTDAEAVARWAFAEQIDLIIPADSAPLRAGLVDEVVAMHIGVCGSAQRTTRIEYSRCFARTFLERYGLPLPHGRVCRDLATAEKYLASLPLPVIIKADDPTHGEAIYADRYAALEALRTAFAEDFAGPEHGGVVIEEYLSGPVISFSALTDGVTALPLLPVRCYDRLGPAPDSPLAPNMGAMVGNSVYSRRLGAYLDRHILRPLLNALRQENLPFWGFIGVDCVLAHQGPRVTGLRCSLRNMEAQAVLPLLESDLAPLIAAAVARRLDREPPLVWRDEACVALALVSQGYPHHFPMDARVTGLDEVDPGVFVFHDQTYNPSGLRYGSMSRDRFAASLHGGFSVGDVTVRGGHVVTVVASGATLAGARGRALVNAERIHFPGRTYREDIGAREFG